MTQLWKKFVILWSSWLTVKLLADFEFEPSDGIIPDNRRTKDV
jgi:hypothetical protein